MQKLQWTSWWEGFKVNEITWKILEDAIKEIEKVRPYEVNYNDVVGMIKAGMRPTASCRWLLVGATAEQREEVYRMLKSDG